MPGPIFCSNPVLPKYTPLTRGRMGAKRGERKKKKNERRKKSNLDFNVRKYGKVQT